MLSKRVIWLLLVLIPAVNLRFSTDKNMIWTLWMKTNSTTLLEFVSGDPLTHSGETVQVQTLTASPSRIKPYCLTFDYQNSCLYFTSSSDTTYYKMDLSNPAQLQMEGVHIGFSSSNQIAMDWSTGNLYWIDVLFSWIAMKFVTKNLVTDFKILVESDIENPLSLALDPTRGHMFWTERRKTSLIRRASLDGTDKRVLSVGGLVSPISMTIDITTGKIYWVDYNKGTIESCFSDGRERRVIKKNPGLQFVGIAYYKSTLFVTEDVTKHVYAFREDTGSPKSSSDGDPNENPGSIIVYAGELQPSLPDLCSNLNCEHFCVRTVSSARCLCQDGYILSADGHSCTGSAIYSPRLLAYTNKTHVCFVNITTVFIQVNQNCLIKNGIDFTAIVSDALHRVVYIADRGRNKIFSVSLRIGAVATTVSSVGEIEGLAFDWLSNTIYWTDSSSRSINSFGITSKKKTTETVAVSGRLGGVTVDPFERNIYWVTTNPPRIMTKGYGSGGAIRTLVNSDIIRPADIHCDPVKQRVLWTDSGSIKVVNMDGTEQKKLISTKDSNNRGLVSTKSIMFWTSQYTETRLNAGTIDNGQIANVTIQSSSELVDVDILDVSAQQTTRGVCFDNGGCDHHCVPMPSGRECRCELGYKLQADGRTCTTEFLRDEHILVTDIDSKILYQVDISSGQLFGSLLLNDSTTAVAVDPSFTVLYWSDMKQAHVKSSYLNGSSIKTLFGTGLEYADRLAVDSSTGNIFYTANPILSQTVGRGYIGIASPDGETHRQLVTGLSSPRALQLHSSHGIMFWSDFGNPPHIGRANMDGSHRVNIISKDIESPGGIAIDFEVNLLYWTDGSRNVIERCSFYGFNRQIILQDNDAHLMALVINKNILYYTAWNRQGITAVNKADGSNRRFLAESPVFGRLGDLIIVRPNSRQTGTNACSYQNGGCSTFCLPTETTKICACADGIYLQLDGLTCVGATPRQQDTTTATTPPRETTAATTRMKEATGATIRQRETGATTTRLKEVTSATARPKETIATNASGETKICLAGATARMKEAAAATTRQREIGATTTRPKETTAVVTNGRNTLGSDPLTERQSGSEVKIASISAGTIIIVAVLVVVAVVLVRRKKTNRPDNTDVYSDPQVSRRSVSEDYTGYAEYCYIRDSVLPPIPPNHPPVYTETARVSPSSVSDDYTGYAEYSCILDPPAYTETVQENTSAGVYLTPISESAYCCPKT